MVVHDVILNGNDEDLYRIMDCIGIDNVYYSEQNENVDY